MCCPIRCGGIEPLDIAFYLGEDEAFNHPLDYQQVIHIIFRCNAYSLAGIEMTSGSAGWQACSASITAAPPV